MLARKDAPASYHLCVTHDDARQGVTLVTRGEDLRPSTDLHRLLQALMGWPEPAYAHHRLIMDAEGKRLAKRDRAATLRDMRERGVSPRDVIDRLAKLEAFAHGPHARTGPLNSNANDRGTNGDDGSGGGCSNTAPG